MAARAYTMLEMAAALLIVLLIVSLAVGLYRNDETADALRHGEALRELATTARLAALRGTEPVSLCYLPTERKWFIPGRSGELHLPEGIALYLDGKEIPVNGEELTLISFFPDGRITQAALELRQEELSVTLRTSELTGGVTLSEGETATSEAIWLEADQ